MGLEMWAVAALAIVDASGTPLILRTYTSPGAVLQSPLSPAQAHLYVGPEDIIKLHFLLFSSLDRCEEQWAASKQRRRNEAAGAGLVGNSAPGTPTLHASSSSKATIPPTADDTAVRVQEASAVTASSSARLVTSTTDIRFMGRLIHSYRFQSYGFCSATGIKTILATVGGEAPQDAVVPLCRAIYECASGALCNPFRTPAQSWKAQQAVAAKTYQQLLEHHHHSVSDEDNDVSLQLRMDALLNTSLVADLPSGGGMLEFTTRGAPPTPQNLTQEPTLGLSQVFNTQLETILSSFTATARSIIIE